MSKSLGNVLDPFEVIEEFGTDALRFYLMRDVAFGADGAVGMDAVRARYEAELANEYGNLASRTIAMVHRYRDGVVPDGRARPRARGRVRGAARARGRAVGPRRASRPRWSRSGSGCGAATATSRSARRGSWPRPRRPPPQLEDAGLAGRGAARAQRAPASVHAGQHRAAARRARRPAASTTPDARCGAAAAVGRSPSSSRCSPSGRDRQPHPSRLPASPRSPSWWPPPRPPG